MQSGAGMPMRETESSKSALRETLLLAESVAWRRIAERIDAHYEPVYLCWFVAPGDYSVTYRIDAWTTDRGLRTRMLERVRYHLAGGFQITDGDAPKNIRVLAALFLALECEDEARALQLDAALTRKPRAPRSPKPSPSLRKK